MKKLLLALPALLSAFSGRYDVCFHGEFGIEALYWKPCTEGYQFAEASATVDDVLVASEFVVNPDYDWGFRLFGNIVEPTQCTFVGLDFLYLQSTNRGTMDQQGVIFLPQEASVVNAEAETRLRYYRVNLRAGHAFYTCNCSRVFLYGGGRYLYLREKQAVGGLATEMIQAVQVEGNRISEQESRFTGGGIEAGLGAYIEVCQGLSINTNLGAIAAIGSRSSRLAVDDGASPFSVKFPSRTACIPGVEARIGLAYSVACGCTVTLLEVGYEIDHYFNALALWKAANSPQVSFTTDVGFAGPYISLLVGF